MHPAYSVIVFTTASGAGYGLLALLGALAGVGLLPPDRRLGLVGLGTALALITAGLLSSTAHLGRPARAWRAFSQWRTSWLSREAIAAVATCVPAGLFALGWVVLGSMDPWVMATGLLSAVGAAATVSATAMIYASLKPVAQWHSGFTLPAYLAFSAMTGLTLLNAIFQGLGFGSPDLVLAAVGGALIGWGVKYAAWRDGDAAGSGLTANAATGLAGGSVRSLEWPHTNANYVLKEMGYRVARKHASRLRGIAQALAFALPAIVLLAGLAIGGWAATVLSVLAAPIQLAGMLVERWLFFAEAKHTAALYYGL
jgi:sulfite dehydrogenase (quinone) subunit SoeC